MIAMLLALAVHTHMTLVAWHGSDLPTATSSAAKYRLTLVSAPGGTIELRTSGVERGWIAAFCDARVCSPNRVREKMPAVGTLVLQFELIREEPDAPRSSGAAITASDGAAVRVPRASP